MLSAKISAVHATLTNYLHAAPRNNQHCVSAICRPLSGAWASISTVWDRQRWQLRRDSSFLNRIKLFARASQEVASHGDGRRVTGN